MDFLVLWLDNDREGENICFEVIDICERVMNQIPKGFDRNIYRARFSSLVKQDLRDAFYNIHEEPNYNESLSVDARQIIDLKIGVVFSRFQTIYFTKKYQHLSDKMISFGPCQTPTLGFCVRRSDDILKFEPKPYYKINVDVAKDGEDQLFTLEWDQEKTFNQVKIFFLIKKIF